jgi:3'-5' exoribonuclease
MKRQFARRIKAGETLDDIFVLTAKSAHQTRTGKPYLRLTVADRSGALEGVSWEPGRDVADGVTVGQPVSVQGRVAEYNGQLQVTVGKMAPHTAPVDPVDFLPRTERRDPERDFEALVKITADLEDPWLRRLLEAFWTDADFVRQFKTAPAAKKVHHAYVGGLVIHCLSMARWARFAGQHYRGVDADLLTAGAILHDIGKIRELTCTLQIDYSDSGRLLSHIVIGCQMIDEKVATLPGFPEETALLLKHMVVSHHGQRAYGSPEPPKTIEAVLLHFIDEIDSKVNGIRDFAALESDGEPWTAYHRLWERHFYLGRSARPDHGDKESDVRND